MYLPSVIVLLCLALHHTEANIIKQPELCNSGYCLPKHLCPTGNIKDVPALGQNDFITLQVDEESECGDFMKICCAGSSLTNTVSIPANDAVPIADQSCGNFNPQGLVYNVESNLTYAKYAEFPWTVAIFQMSFSSKNIELTHVGGGALIHPKFILTAAHTLKKPHRYVARFGEWNIKSDAEIYPAKDIEIEEYITHPLYREKRVPYNQIALALLEEKVIYSEHIRPICLPTPRDVMDGQRCIATGWGIDVRTEQPASIMKRMELNVFSVLRCRLMFLKLGILIPLDSGYICASAAGDQNSCTKDGGSPLACQRDDGSYVLAGLTTWAIDCGRTNVPGGYVDVAKFAGWVYDTIELYEKLHSEEEDK